MKLNDVVNIITAYEGGMVTLIFDSEPINDDFLFYLKEKLKNNYKIIETQDREELEKYREEKTIIIHKYDKNLKYRYVDCKNVILIILRNHYQTSNTSLIVQAGQLTYIASLILLFKNT